MPHASVVTQRRFNLLEQLAMNFSNLFRGNFRMAIESQQPVNLLLDVRQLGVAETSQERQRRNAFHQVTVFNQ